MSAHDIALLSQIIVQRFPEYYRYFQEKTFTFNGIKQGNRNPLIYKNIGADGLKTGHTEDSGYGLAASAERDGRRIVLVVNGLDSVRSRSSESERLMNWAFRSFKSYSLFEKGQEVDKAIVWLGKEATIPLVVEEPVKVTVNRKARNDLKATIKYTAPIPAPIKEGTPVAELVVTAPGLEPKTVPLLAGADVERLGVFGRLGAAVKYLIFGPQG
jgi:D-alanyl-D-alanine carboxypeptidase (penicillin-binding protein 5/6)